MDSLAGSLNEPFDALITDPPFAIANDFGIMTGKGSCRRRALSFEWDGPETKPMVVQVLDESFALLGKTSACFVFCGFDTLEAYAAPAREHRFTIKPAIWLKTCPPPAGKNHWWPSAFALAYYGYRKSPYFGDDDPKRNNVFEYDSYRHGNSNKNGHPTQMSLDLARRLVRSLCPPGGRVLDPFGGSGTIAVACAVEDRQCVSIELDPKYSAISLKRVTEVVGWGVAAKGMK